MDADSLGGRSGASQVEREAGKEQQANEPCRIQQPISARTFSFTGHVATATPSQRTVRAAASRSCLERDRQAHGQSLRGAARLEASSGGRSGVPAPARAESGLGLQIEFVGQPDVELAFQSLADDRKKIELLSVRKEGDVTFANVFVPDGGPRSLSSDTSPAYLEDKKLKEWTRLDHKALLNTIASIRVAELRALWTDDPALLPADSG